MTSAARAGTGARALARAAAFLLVVLLCMVIPEGGEPAFAQETDSSSAASNSASSSASSTTTQAPAVSSDPFTDAAPVSLGDGVYLVDVELTGGSGKASITSPAELDVRSGVAAVYVEWSSPNYDYMIVDGKKYLPVNESGNSAFLIPVLAYDKPFDVVGDTTAMSEAHEIDYRIEIALDTAQLRVDDSDIAAENAPLSIPWIVFIVCASLSAVILIVVIVILRHYRRTVN